MSFSDISRLVKTLYAPGTSPTAIMETQRVLQSAQKSPAGWQLADYLLDDPSLNCKFFGALTYTVKMGQELPAIVSSHDWAQFDQLVDKFMNKLLQLVFSNESGGLFVVKKMLSNLAVLYISGLEHWKYPLESYMQSVLTRSSVHSEKLQDVQLLSVIAGIQTDTVVLFSKIIAEELIKKEVVRIDQAKLHQIIHDNVFGITEKLLSTVDVTPGWFECVDSWVSYTSRAEFDSTVRYNMTNLLGKAIDYVSQGSSEAMETVVGALDTNYSFFKPELKDKLNALIFGPWGTQFLQEESPQFARMVILFLEPDIVILASKLALVENDAKFQFLLQLTDFPGEPISEESVSTDFIDFWLQFAESFLDDEERLDLLVRDRQRFHDSAHALFVKVSQIYWSKIHVPSDVDGFKDEFQVYRRDVGDLFETLYPIIKLPLYTDLIGSVVGNLDLSSLDHVEASLFLLNAVSADFSECVTAEVLQDVRQIFASNFLELVSSALDPSKFQYVIHTTIKFLSSVDWFYKSPSGLPYLPQILNFLFETMVGSQNYQLIASKAIASICDNCRDSLYDSLPIFKGIIIEMVNDSSVEPLTRQRIINSYASIIQGVRDPAVQGQYLHDLFVLLSERALEALGTFDATPEPQQEQAREYLISLISSVSAIGKGMQLPDSPEEVYEPEELDAMNKYWLEDPLKVHDQVIELIKGYSTVSVKLAESLRVTEEIASIFKSGMTESILGPFVFHPSVVVDFITSKFQSLVATTTYPLLYNLYSNLIRAYHGTIENVAPTLQTIYLDRLQAIESDPDCTQAVINMFGTILATTPSLLVSEQPMLEKVIDFCIVQLSANERFILKALELFWTRLIYLRRGTHRDTMAVKRLFNETQLGVLLTTNVIRCMLQTQRSNLEFFTEIFKALIAKYPMLASQWLDQAFTTVNQERIAQSKKPIEDYQLFIKKVTITRGTRAANGLIKDFWLQTNGLVDYGI